MFSSFPKLSVGTSISTWRLISETKNEEEEGVHPGITESLRHFYILYTNIHAKGVHVHIRGSGFCATSRNKGKKGFMIKKEKGGKSWRPSGNCKHFKQFFKSTD